MKKQKSFNELLQLREENRNLRHDISLIYDTFMYFVTTLGVDDVVSWSLVRQLLACQKKYAAECGRIIREKRKEQEDNTNDA